jgi:predicted small lipoprotein YifL
MRLLLALALACAGCGAKTGLDTPDANVDAGRDGGVDAAFDAGHDAGPPIRCILVPPTGGPVSADFSIPATLQIVDVMFLIDATGSMRDEINNVRAGLRDVVIPGVTSAIPDAAFGLAFFGEFPVLPHADPRSGVRPYELRSPITTDVERLTAAFEGIPTWGNLDDPEADVEGLFQVATGEGLEPYIDPSFGCPSGGTGGVCFRADAFRVVLLATDAPMHNGPPGVSPIAPYTFTDPSPHQYAETVAALRNIGVTVIGLGATDPGRPSPLPHLTQLVADVDTHHMPLVFDIGNAGDQIGQDIVMALERLADGVPLDVSASVEDVPGDAIDARTLVTAVRAVSANPMSNVTGISGSGFTGVTPGTQLTFQIDVDGSVLPPSATRREVRARVVFRDAGRSRVGSEDVSFVIPGMDGLGCP